MNNETDPLVACGCGSVNVTECKLRLDMLLDNIRVSILPMDFHNRVSKLGFQELRVSKISD